MADALALGLREMVVAHEYRALGEALPTDPLERRVAVARVVEAHRGTLDMFRKKFGARVYEALIMWLTVIAMMFTAAVMGCGGQIGGQVEGQIGGSAEPDAGAGESCAAECCALPRDNWPLCFRECGAEDAGACARPDGSAR